MAVARLLELGARGDRLRLDRKRRHRGRLARRQGRRRRLRLLPQQSRARQGARLPGARRRRDPARRQLRRSEPRLPRARAGERHRVRQHHSAAVLRRGREDGGLRDRRAARLGLARPHGDARRRRDALLAGPQGARGARDRRPRRDRRDEDQHRPGRRLRADRHRDPRRQRRARSRRSRTPRPTRWRSERRATARW